MDRTLKNKRGVTLIELLVALVLSAILIAALYRTFIGQQKTYMVQEQVVDMQQNARVAVNKMMREIRMAGFGGVDSVLNLAGGVNGFTQAIVAGPTTITIVGGFKQIRLGNGDPIVIGSASGNQITLNFATDEFDGGAPHRFISIGGVESNTVQSRSNRTLTLNNPISYTHPVGTPIFKIHAITYGLRNNDDGVTVLFRDLYSNTGSSQRDTVAEDIENLQFEYFDGGNPSNLLALPIADSGIIRMVRVTVTARTDRLDPDFKSGDGYRRRTIASNIYVRNMGLSP